MYTGKAGEQWQDLIVRTGSRSNFCCPLPDVPWVVQEIPHVGSGNPIVARVLLSEKLTQGVTAFLQLQIDSGVDAIQIFDSLAGVLPLANSPSTPNVLNGLVILRRAQSTRKARRRCANTDSRPDIQRAGCPLACSCSSLCSSSLSNRCTGSQYGRSCRAATRLQ